MRQLVFRWEVPGIVDFIPESVLTPESDGTEFEHRWKGRDGSNHTARCRVRVHGSQAGESEEVGDVVLSYDDNPVNRDNRVILGDMELHFADGGTEGEPDVIFHGRHGGHYRARDIHWEDARPEG